MRPPLLPALSVCAIVVAVACSGDKSPDETETGTVSRQGRQGRLVEARVLGVVDGATVEVQIGDQVFRVHYLGVDLAEPEQNDRPSLSQQALEYNRFLVEGRTVELERGSTETDLSGNLLRYVYVDGEMVNKALLTNGYATVSEFPSDFEYKMEFLVAEETAKASSRGVWAPPAGRDRSLLDATATPVPGFGGGTLPVRPPAGVCAYSGTSEAVIKGNVDSRTGERTYHVPDGLFYATTVVDEAIAAGWHPSKR